MNPTWHWLQPNGASLNLAFLSTGPPKKLSYWLGRANADLWFDNKSVNQAEGVQPLEKSIGSMICQ